MPSFYQQDKSASPCLTQAYRLSVNAKFPSHSIYHILSKDRAGNLIEADERNLWISLTDNKKTTSLHFSCSSHLQLTDQEKMLQLYEL